MERLNPAYSPFIILKFTLQQTRVYHLEMEVKKEKKGDTKPNGKVVKFSFQNNHHWLTFLGYQALLCSYTAHFRIFSRYCRQFSQSICQKLEAGLHILYKSDSLQAMC